jgi:ribonuclease Z
VAVNGDPDETEVRAWWRSGGVLHERLLPLGQLKSEVLRLVPGEKIAYVTMW